MQLAPALQPPAPLVRPASSAGEKRKSAFRQLRRKKLCWRRGTDAPTLTMAAIKKIGLRILDWTATLVYLPTFVAIFFVFHAVEVGGRLVAGAAGLEWAYERMCWAHLRALELLTGAKFQFSGPAEFPAERTLIFVSNHQSMYDIPLIIWNFRSRRPRFVAKQELGRWIPAASYALRGLGHALINRRDPRAAVQEIREFGKGLAARGCSAAIFPEGTRARNGRMKSFTSAGVASLLEAAEAPLVVPVAIDGSWRFTERSLWPVRRGLRTRLTALEPVEPGGLTGEEACRRAESAIRAALGQEPAPSGPRLSAGTQIQA